MSSSDLDQLPNPRGTSPPNDDAFARQLRGFGPIGILAMIVVILAGPLFEPFGMIPALWWVHRSRTPWRELGFVRPKSWLPTAALGIVLGTGLKVVLKTVVMPLLGAPEINPAYHYLAGNTAALPGMIFAVVVGAGFGEELVFRGFVFERFGKLIGSGPVARAMIVLFGGMWFGGIHYFTQGLAGAEQAVITGVVFGAVYMATRQIWLVMIAHATFDLVAVAIIYFNLETTFAHFVFK